MRLIKLAPALSLGLVLGSTAAHAEPKQMTAHGGIVSQDVSSRHRCECLQPRYRREAGVHRRYVVRRLVHRMYSQPSYVRAPWHSDHYFPRYTPSLKVLVSYQKTY
jgi:hypothetical protein